VDVAGHLRGVPHRYKLDRRASLVSEMSGAGAQGQEPGPPVSSSGARGAPDGATERPAPDAHRHWFTDNDVDWVTNRPNTTTVQVKGGVL